VRAPCTGPAFAHRHLLIATPDGHACLPHLLAMPESHACLPHLRAMPPGNARGRCPAQPLGSYHDVRLDGERKRLPLLWLLVMVLLLLLLRWPLLAAPTCSWLLLLLLLQRRLQLRQVRWLWHTHHLRAVAQHGRTTVNAWAHARQCMAARASMHGHTRVTCACTKHRPSTVK